MNETETDHYVNLTNKLNVIANEAMSMNAMEKCFLLRNAVAARFPYELLAMLTGALMAPKETIRAYKKIIRRSR